MSKIEPLVSVTDLESLPDDGNHFELIEGELFVSRAPSLKHQIVVKNFIGEIDTHLKTNPTGTVLPGPGVVFSEWSGVIPDVAYASAERWASIASAQGFTAAPDLVTEVLSPGKANEDRDRVAKRQLYGKYQVTEYWIADPEQRTVEIYRLGASGLEPHETLGVGDTPASPLLPGLAIPLAAIFDFGMLVG
jgi:Uma2 family endonuclease